MTLFSLLEMPSVCPALCLCHVSSAKVRDECCVLPQAELFCPPEGPKGWGLPNIYPSLPTMAMLRPRAEI